MAKIINIASWSLGRVKKLNMKRENSTDQIFSDKLGDYASAPPMHIWERIDKKRSPMHKAKLLLLRNWKIAAFSIVLLGLVGYYFTTSNNDQGENLHAQIIEKPLQGNQASTLTDNQDDQALNNQITLPAVEQQQRGSSLDKANRATSTIKESNKDEQQTQLSNSNNFTSTLTETSEKGKILDEQKESNQHAFLDSKETENTIKNFQQDHISENDNIHQTRSPLFENEKEVLGELTKVAQPEYQIAIPNPEFPFDPEKGCPKIEKARNFSLQMDMVVGPDMAVRSLQPKSPDQVNYLREREATESYRYAFSGGVRVSMIRKKGLALRTGLMYAQINEKFEYFDGFTEQYKYDAIRDPQTGSIIGYDTTIVYGELNLKTFNRFHILDIPLIAGFHVENEKWAYSVNAGANLNFLFRKKGKFLSPDLNPVSFSTSEADAYQAFRNTLGVSIYGSINLNYKLSNRIQVVIEPNFRYYLNPFSRDDYLLNQEYFSVGVLTGLRMRL